jgi:hypothetical protein
MTVSQAIVTFVDSDSIRSTVSFYAPSADFSPGGIDSVLSAMQGLSHCLIDSVEAESYALIVSPPAASSGPYDIFESAVLDLAMSSPDVRYRLSIPAPHESLFSGPRKLDTSASLLVSASSSLLSPILVDGSTAVSIFRGWRGRRDPWRT